MDIKQVKHALAVHHFGTFTRAAPEVGISQPALTESVRKLEADLKGPLFLRDSTGCRPTALGKAMLPRFERLVSQFEQTISAAEDIVKLRRVPLRLGLLQSIGLERLAPCLAQHQRKKPEIEIEVLTTTFASLRDGLGNGKFDLGIGSAGEVSGDLIRSDPLYSEDYIVVCPRDHAFAEYDTISIEQIAAETLLDRPKCEMRDQLLGVFEDNDLSLYAPHRTDSIALLKLQVQAGVGIAVVPRYSLEPDHPHLCAKPLEVTGFQRDVLVMRRHDQVQRPETQNLIDMLKRELRCAAPV